MRPDPKAPLHVLHDVPPRSLPFPDDPDLLPDVDVVGEHVFGSRRGFLSVGRRRLAFAAAAVCVLSVTIHELPASASTVIEEGHRASLQSFASFSQPAPVAERSGYDVTSYAVVQWPLDPETRISSHFGYRVAPCPTCSSDHLGVDWNPGYGTPVVAIADGVVVGVNSISGDLGVHVVIEHEIDGVIVQTVSGHLAPGSVPVALGQEVSRGEVVGLVGNSGLSTGTHLHFAVVTEAGAFIDPLPWLRSHVTQAWGE